MIRSKLKLILRSLQKHYILEGLEPRVAASGYSYGLHPAWSSCAKKHSQVISPGRSGTRWLANILVESSNALVCHASPKTLSEVGYLFNQSLISEDQALGAYRFSRSDFLRLASLNDRPFVDMDCKNSPLAHVVARAYSDCKFIVLIRDPISFIRSGIVRGYYMNKDPQAWGHLEPLVDKNSSLASENRQIFKIASFWRSIAQLSQELVRRDSSRVFILNSAAMFRSIEMPNRLMAWLDIDHSDIAKCRSYANVVNANRSGFALGGGHEKLLKSESLYDFCIDGLDDAFVAACGFHERNKS